MLLLLIFITIECYFHKNTNSSDDLLRLFICNIFKHGEGLYFFHSKIVFPCYIFFVYVFHVGLSMNKERRIYRFYLN